MKLDRIIAVRNTKTVYKDGNQCIKIFNNNYSKEDILNEALIHARVEKTGLNVPELVEVSKVDGKWALTYEFIDGRTMQQLMDRNPENMDELLKKFISIQKEVNDIRISKIFTYSEYLITKAFSGIENEQVKRRLVEFVENNSKDQMLCHCDFTPSNVIIGKDDKAWIIDWTYAAAGNPAADASVTYIHFCLNEKYDIAEKYIMMYADGNDALEQDIRKWIPVAAASRYASANERTREILNRYIKDLI